jgi:hypothetical protein
MRHVTRNVLQICMLKMIRELARFPSAWPRLAHRARIGILRLASEAARAMRAASSPPDTGRRSQNECSPAATPLPRACCERRPGSSVVERGPEKAGVGGSIPSLATII